jgi:hypothetical protein
MAARVRLPYVFPPAAGGVPSGCVARAVGEDAPDLRSWPVDLRLWAADRRSPAASCRRRPPVVDLHQGEPAEAGVAEDIVVLR